MYNKVLGSLRGIVETLEQKSGLNSLLYLNAIIAFPCLVLYNISGKSIYMAFVWLLVVFTLTIYGIAFKYDRNFLRSEKHVKDMRQLEMLGEKGKEISELDVQKINPVEDKTPKKLEGKVKR